MSKVAELNLECGNPTVTTAISNMKNALTTYKRQGYKAIILIHGYGSTGVGGSIKVAVTKCLCDDSMCGIVRSFVGGEQWYNRRREMLGVCKGLEDYERRILGNNGVTVVILR